MVDWLNYFFFCDRCVDQNRNWTVRLSSRRCLCGLNAGDVVREPCQMLLSNGVLKNFMDVLSILKSFYLYLLTMFWGGGKIKQQLLSLDQ